nr:MAG TPA: hypothetical protein [Bacteriophage sp.]
MVCGQREWSGRTRTNLPPFVNLLCCKRVN